MLEVAIKSFVLVLPVLIAIERKKLLVVILSFLFVMTPTGLDLMFNISKDLRWILQALQIVLWILVLLAIIKDPTSSSGQRASSSVSYTHLTLPTKRIV